MSKSLGNIIDPWEVLDRQGADALRWYLLTSGSPWASRRVGMSILDEVVRRFLLTLWNVYAFFVTYANASGFDPRTRRGAPLADRPLLDRWVLSQLADMVASAHATGSTRYDATGAGRRIAAFLDDLSNWYVRRARRRFWIRAARAAATPPRRSPPCTRASSRSLGVAVAVGVAWLGVRPRRLVVAAGRAQDDRRDDRDDHRDAEEGEALRTWTRRENLACADVLVRDDDLIIGQPAHAWVSGQLARAWGNAAFPAPEPFEAVCLAAEQHDVGWADADLAPLLGPDGRPRSFMSIRGRCTWRSGRTPRGGMLAQSRYAALLVSLHGTSLYQRIDAGAQPPAVAAAIRAYLAEQHALQAALAAGLDPGEVDRNRRLMLALDALSLALCHDRAATLEGVPARRPAAPRSRRRVQPAARRRSASRARVRGPGAASSRRLRGAAAPGHVFRRAGAARRARIRAVGAAELGAQPRLIPRTSSRPSVERGSTPCAARNARASSSSASASASSSREEP